MKNVKPKVKGTVFFHIYPKNDVDAEGNPFIHDIRNGADCPCEPMCKAEFHPTKPDVPFFIIVHRQDRISCTTVSLISYKPPPMDDPYPGPSDDKDSTPPPRWSW